MRCRCWRWSSAVAIITQDNYDVAPHSAKCDAAMQGLADRVVELEHQVNALQAQFRKLGITVSKLGDAVGDFNTHIEGDWHLNE